MTENDHRDRSFSKGENRGGKRGDDGRGNQPGQLGKPGMPENDPYCHSYGQGGKGGDGGRGNQPGQPGKPGMPENYPYCHSYGQGGKGGDGGRSGEPGQPGMPGNGPKYYRVFVQKCHESTLVKFNGFSTTGTHCTLWGEMGHLL